MSDQTGVRRNEFSTYEQRAPESQHIVIYHFPMWNHLFRSARNILEHLERSSSISTLAKYHLPVFFVRNFGYVLLFKELQAS